MSSILTVTIVVTVVPLAMLIVFSAAALLLRSTVWATICEVIAHGGFALGLLTNFYLLIPQFKRMVADFGTELPAMTKVVIALSDLTVNYWYVILFFILAGCVIDAWGFATFHRTPESRYVARTFSVVITLALLAQAVFAAYAILHSRAPQLLQGLR